MQWGESMNKKIEEEQKLIYQARTKSALEMTDEELSSFAKMYAEWASSEFCSSSVRAEKAEMATLCLTELIRRKVWEYQTL